MSSCSIINLSPAPLVAPKPCIFHQSRTCILPSIADIAAVKPNGANTFLANGNAT